MLFFIIYFELLGKNPSEHETANAIGGCSATVPVHALLLLSDAAAHRRMVFLTFLSRFDQADAGSGSTGPTPPMWVPAPAPPIRHAMLASGYNVNQDDPQQSLLVNRATHEMLAAWCGLKSLSRRSAALAKASKRFSSRYFPVANAHAVLARPCTCKLNLLSRRSAALAKASSRFSSQYFTVANA